MIVGWEVSALFSKPKMMSFMHSVTMMLSSSLKCELLLRVGRIRTFRYLCTEPRTFSAVYSEIYSDKVDLNEIEKEAGL